jgi:hypothetical protein
MDACDPKFGETLTMSLGAAVILAALFLKNHDRTSPALVNDFSGDLGALDQGLPDDQALVAMDEPHIAQFHGATHIAGKTFHLNEGSILDPVLLAACFDYCIHESLPP